MHTMFVFTELSVVIYVAKSLMQLYVPEKQKCSFYKAQKKKKERNYALNKTPMGLFPFFPFQRPEMSLLWENNVKRLIMSST